jgi:hypothetical protein
MNFWTLETARSNFRKKHKRDAISSFHAYVFFEHGPTHWEEDALIAICTFPLFGTLVIGSCGFWTLC